MRPSAFFAVQVLFGELLNVRRTCNALSVRCKSEL